MRRPAFVALAALPLMVWATEAVGADFLSTEEAQHLMFPSATSFEPVLVSLTSASALGISARGRCRPPGCMSQSRAIRCLAPSHSMLWIGKFQLINYAVSCRPKRCGQGHRGAGRTVRRTVPEVRNAAWRQQFVGKTAAEPLQVGNDIDNISGATLSCTHLTDGVRKLARLVQASAHA